MKPLSEQELQRQVADKIALVAHGNSFNNLDPDKRASIAYAVVEMVQFILSDRKAWGEYVINTPHPVGCDITCAKLLKDAQRQRNQGEKTDE
jgi:hypothetical protein